MSTTARPRRRDINVLLVANRGEIARRVFRTAREMGIRTVAVYVAAESDAPFVHEADSAVRIPSYMDSAAVVAAAVAAGADAIHPGYGFLSENADFAQAVIDADISWVGPHPDVIAAMGDKLEAKKRAEAAGVPTLPSSEDPTAGSAVGYPLLVKASAGGGGKGMRVVDNADVLDELVAAARREALSGFGNDTVFLERYVPSARHVEIQIMGDSHGTVIHYGERECSIQRRHQKIIEESPSPGIDDATRQAMAEAAVSLGQSIGYESAGTVEFLVDDDTGEFFFLEVNTRLQVEHPVTEMALGGIDLVRSQLEIAAGGRAAGPAVVQPMAAIEVRLYAEDPTSEFLPATGHLHTFCAADGPGIRWDSGVEQGNDVTVSFDPMLAKVTAWGADRTETARRLARELEELHIGGVVTNRDFLVNVLRSAEFLAGDTTTDFIERVDPPRELVLAPNELQRAAVVAAFWLQGRNRDNDLKWGNLPSGFRNGRLPPSAVSFVRGSNTLTVAYKAQRGGLSFRVAVASTWLDGAAIAGLDLDSTVRVLGWSSHIVDLEFNGMRRQHQVTASADHIWVQMPTGTVELALVPKFVVPGATGPSGGFKAPMPGVVLDVRVRAGESVTKGQTLVILEAMKMEHHMNAAEDGVVADVLVKTGQQVEKDSVLLTMVDDDEAGDGQ